MTTDPTARCDECGSTNRQLVEGVLRCIVCTVTRTTDPTARSTDRLMTAQQAALETLRTLVVNWDADNYDAADEAFAEARALLELPLPPPVGAELAAHGTADPVESREVGRGIVDCSMLMCPYEKRCADLEAALAILQRERDELRRKSQVDDVAFASANSLCVDATMRADAAERARDEARARCTELEGRARAMVTEWRSRAGQVRPLDGTPISAEKRARVAEWMWYTNRANELAACLGERSDQTPTAEP